MKNSILIGIFGVLLFGMGFSSAYGTHSVLFGFGSSGNADDELQNPLGVATSKSGQTIYVADTDNDRINAFDDNGEHLFDFGSFCDMSSDQNCNDNYPGAQEDGDGQFNEPTDIAIDSVGNIYVVDSQNNRVQKFDDDRDFESKFGSSNSAESDYLGEPRSIVIRESTNRVYVSDLTTDSISVFDSSGNFESKFGSTGSGDGQFRNPSEMAIDDDILYVVDTDNDRIQKFQLVSSDTCPSGTTEIVDGVCFVEDFGSTGSDDGEFDSPAGLAWDETNEILYVTDTGNDRIQAFSEEGTSSKLPATPANFEVEPASPTSIVLTWDKPDQSKSTPSITGYKIEFKTGTESFTTLISNTQSTRTSFLHEGLEKDERYSYRIYSINSEGTSGPSSTLSAKPEHSTVPPGVDATDVSPNQILLTWYPPSDTFNQDITGYSIKRVITPGVYEDIASTNPDETSYTVDGLQTGKQYSFVIVAQYTFGSSAESKEASATPEEDSEPPVGDVISTPSAPRDLTASAVSPTEIKLRWRTPSDDGGSAVTGYKIESKNGNESYSIVTNNTKSSSITYNHRNLNTDIQYTFRIYAINSAGTGPASNEASATPSSDILRISPLGTFSINEGSSLSFTVNVDGVSSGLVFSLDDAPDGATIDRGSGRFNWNPDATQGGKSYAFDVMVTKGSSIDTESVTIVVNDVLSSEPEESEQQEEPTQPEETEEPEQKEIPASFVDSQKDPQHYVDRYNNEPNYKEWFDENYPEYSSIYEAVGLEKPREPLGIAPFVDQTEDPQYYVDRYNNEPKFKEWFDENFAEYDSIYEAVGLKEPKQEVGICGPNTVLKDGVCVPKTPEPPVEDSSNTSENNQTAIIAGSIVGILAAAGIPVYFLKFRKVGIPKT